MCVREKETYKEIDRERERERERERRSDDGSNTSYPRVGHVCHCGLNAWLMTGEITAVELLPAGGRVIGGHQETVV